jgi:hypothetical protein
MKKSTKTTLFYILNFALLGVFGIVLHIYSSGFKFSPWYDPEGMSFMAIFLIIHPIFLVVGISLIFLGRSLPVEKLNVLIPFISIASFYVESVPILKNLDFILFGFLTNLILFFLLIFTICKTMILIKKEQLK